ncbi:C-Maf-inducing protein-like isoform X2 [Limulus polyphemus]|uniref:C-Maf-inducing protein-like isoform X2 n=1 Tax=Limulus polyphemus TaxID=6850 RepID=A0ABM1TBJ2_LIMPO|nr:C-Maf-inducing protein-like isoform X2 [Limulus polyphemus]
MSFECVCANSRPCSLSFTESNSSRCTVDTPRPAREFSGLISEGSSTLAVLHPSLSSPTLKTGIAGKNTLHCKRCRQIKSMDTHPEHPSCSGRTCISGHQGSSMGYIPTCGSPLHSYAGTKLKLLHETDVLLCKVFHSRNVVHKFLGSKFLRKWENHHLFFTDSEIISRSPSGFMENPIFYSQIEEIYCLPNWTSSRKICIRLVIPEGSIVVQVNNPYMREQWLHSLYWKRTMLRHRMLLSRTERYDVLIKELKSLVDLALSTPLQGENIFQIPLDIISNIVTKEQSWKTCSSRETVISIIAPLLERISASAEICDFLCRHCKESPRSYVIVEVLPPIIQRILKHTMDFGKHPNSRLLVQSYIQAINEKNDGINAVKDFVRSVHGPVSSCPHPRLMPNLVSTSLAALYSLFEEKKRSQGENLNITPYDTSTWESRHLCFLTIFQTIVSFEDWRPGLAQLLQPIPFPHDALAYAQFTKNFKLVIESICKDPRCEVHLALLGIRDDKDGWFQLYCPGSIACDDEGDLWSLILKQFLECCCRRKRFLQSLSKNLGPCMLRALREDETCQQILCAMMEFQIIENKDVQLQIISTLQSTSTGREHYAALCQKQMHLQELQQKGGPRKLALPPKSTDNDLSQLLSCGSFGNLECLSLAFTNITCTSAEQLIKLPSLRYLNLWSTQFGDSGVMLISEHLHNLEVLNLCETQVTDKGLTALFTLKNLRKLNLNSTSLSSHTFEWLKVKKTSNIRRM